MNRKLYVVMAAALMLQGCGGGDGTATEKQGTRKTAEKEKKKKRKAIEPPVAKLDEPVVHYTFLAEDGGTFQYGSGSKITFPANSVVDADGNPVKGKVDVTYREFHDPASVMMSGIPMNYDSAGSSYFFETAGMCEVYAYQNGNPIFVNQANKPTIAMASFQPGNDYNLYALDTASGQWNAMGKAALKKAEPEKVNKGASIKTVFPNKAQAPLPPKPLEPRLADESRQQVQIKVIPGSLPELQAYDNLLFEMHENETGFKPSFVRVAWESMELEAGPFEGTYYVKMYSSDLNIKLLTRPVLEEGDYQEAMAVFKQKQQEYNTLLNKRKEEERLAAEKDKERAEQVKREEQERMAQYQKLMKEQRVRDSLWAEQNKDLIAAQTANGNLQREFAIEGFGIYNCDKPYLAPEVQVEATFVDNSGKPLAPAFLGNAIKGINGYVQSFDAVHLRLDVEKDNVVILYSSGSLYYVTAAQVRKAGLSKDSKTMKFTATRWDEPLETSADMKKVITTLVG
jgi:hypothetical protein